MQMRMVFSAALAGVLAAALFLAGCGGGDSGTTSATTAKAPVAASGPIKIGSLNSMTGLNSTFGQSCDAGIKMAADEANAQGGVLGRKIEIITADTESLPEKTPNAVQKLINQDQVVAVLGEVASARSLAAAPICQRSGVPMLSPASTNPRVTQQGNYIFRSCFTDDFQGVLIARFTAQNLKLMKAALLVDVKNDYSTGLAKVLREEYPKLGGQIVAEESYSAGDSNFKTQLTNLKAANPDIIFLPGYYTEVALICQQARELGMKQPFIGGDGWDSEKTISIGGQAVEGCYFTNHYYAGDPDPRVQGFVTKFKQQHEGAVPDAMAVLGYDAANIMFAAITHAGTTEGPALRDALAATKDFPGVTGNITIGPDRNAVKPGVVLKIEGGKFVMVTRVTP